MHKRTTKYRFSVARMTRTDKTVVSVNQSILMYRIRSLHDCFVAITTPVTADLHIARILLCITLTVVLSPARCLRHCDSLIKKIENVQSQELGICRLCRIIPQFLDETDECLRMSNHAAHYTMNMSSHKYDRAWLWQVYRYLSTEHQRRLVAIYWSMTSTVSYLITSSCYQVHAFTQTDKCFKTYIDSAISVRSRLLHADCIISPIDFHALNV